MKLVEERNFRSIFEQYLLSLYWKSKQLEVIYNSHHKNCKRNFLQILFCCPSHYDTAGIFLLHWQTIERGLLVTHSLLSLAYTLAWYSQIKRGTSWEKNEMNIDKRTRKQLLHGKGTETTLKWSFYWAYSITHHHRLWMLSTVVILGNKWEPAVYSLCCAICSM